MRVRQLKKLFVSVMFTMVVFSQGVPSAEAFEPVICPTPDTELIERYQVDENLRSRLFGELNVWSREKGFDTLTISQDDDQIEPSLREWSMVISLPDLKVSILTKIDGNSIKVTSAIRCGTDLKQSKLLWDMFNNKLLEWGLRRLS